MLWYHIVFVLGNNSIRNYIFFNYDSTKEHHLFDFFFIKNKNLFIYLFLFL